MPLMLRLPEGVGKFQIPGTDLIVDTSRIRDDLVMDSVGYASGTITANTRKNFFTSRDGVLDKQHFFGFSSFNALPPQTALLAIQRIGLYVQQAIGNTTITTDDVCKIVCNGHVYLRLDAKDDVYDGSALGLQGGIGIWGSTGDTTSPIGTNGVPSLGAVPEVHPRAQWAITDRNKLLGQMNHPDATWFNDSNMAGSGSYDAPIISVEAAVSVYFRGPVAVA